MSEKTSEKAAARLEKQPVARSRTGAKSAAAPKVDRRILFTKGLIKEAFLELK